MNKTSIEWTHRPGTIGMTWNPIRARLKNGGSATRARNHGTFCTKVSPGCQHCYASTINKRFGTGLEYTVPNLAEHEFFLSDKILQEPVLYKKPATIFVGDMFDLFHEAIPVEFVAEVLRVAHKTPRHTFQFLTKRAERMRTLVTRAQEHWGVKFGEHMWFGVSVESQQYADERIPLLERTPVAVRFLSVEPLLEEIWIEPELMGQTSCGRPNWVICGGESGPGARPFRYEWAESLLKQCRAADVPFFMKQFGSYAILDPRYDQSISGATRKLHDRKGGDMDEWPEHLRVREFPISKAEAVCA